MSAVRLQARAALHTMRGQVKPLAEITAVGVHVMTHHPRGVGGNALSLIQRREGPLPVALQAADIVISSGHGYTSAFIAPSKASRSNNVGMSFSRWVASQYFTPAA